jgi:hypothetical protein
MSEQMDPAEPQRVAKRCRLLDEGTDPHCLSAAVAGSATLNWT